MTVFRTKTYFIQQLSVRQTYICVLGEKNIGKCIGFHSHSRIFVVVVYNILTNVMYYSFAIAETNSGAVQILQLRMMYS